MSTPGDFSCCDTLVALTAEPRIAGHHSLCPRWGLSAIGARVLVAAQHLDDAMAATTVRQVLDDRMVLLAALVKRDAEVQRLRMEVERLRARGPMCAADGFTCHFCGPARSLVTGKITHAPDCPWDERPARTIASIPPTPEQKRAVEAVIDAISGPRRVAGPPPPTEADWQEAERAAIDSKAEVLQLIRAWHEAERTLTRAEAAADADPDSAEAEKLATEARMACYEARRNLLIVAEIIEDTDEGEPMGKLISLPVDGPYNGSDR